jgi:hypothetical protein
MGSEFELSGFKRGVLETFKRCQQRYENTLLWAMKVAAIPPLTEDLTHNDKTNTSMADVSRKPKGSKYF